MGGYQGPDKQKFKNEHQKRDAKTLYFIYKEQEKRWHQGPWS